MSNQENDIEIEDIALNDGAEHQHTLSELYSALLQKDDMILTIQAEDVQKVRKGLSNTKARSNAKLKDNKLPPDNRRIEFHIISRDQASDTVRLKVWLTSDESIRIFELTTCKDIGDSDDD